MNNLTVATAKSRGGGLIVRSGALAALAILLAMLAFVPKTALGATIDLSYSYGANNMNIGAESFDNVKDLNKKIKSSDVGKWMRITLNGDLHATEVIELPADKDVDLNLNGYKIDRNPNNTQWRRNGGILYVGKKTNLTVNGGPKRDHSTTYHMWYKSGRVDENKTNMGGVLTGGASTNTSGGIHVLAGSSITLNDVTLCGCRSEQTWGSDGYGGGIWADGSNITISLNNSSIRGCYAYNDGGGVYCFKEAFRLNMKNSHIDQNYAGDSGGGVKIGKHTSKTGNKTAIIGDGTSTISFNTSAVSGGGLHVLANSARVEDLVISNNKAEKNNGGGLVAVGEDMSLSGLTIKDNQASTGGGIWFACDMGSSISSCTITNNTAQNNGGGVYATGYMVNNPTLSHRSWFALSGTTIIRDNANGNLVIDSSTQNGGVNAQLSNLSLTRQADVRATYTKPKEQRVAKKASDCTRNITYENGDWHFEFNKDSREIWLKSGTEPAKPSTPVTTIAATDAMSMQEEANLTEYGYPVYSGYTRFPNAEDSNKDTVVKFYYSDGFFAGADPTKYNPHLATTSLDMAMSGFYLNAGSNKDYTNKHASARQFMASIGCADEDIYVNDFNVQKPGTSTIGVTIASKPLKDANGNETGEILIPVAVRGANYEAEWSSNVTLGDGTNAPTGREAQGFGEAANQVTERIAYYLAEHGLQDKVGKLRFWVAGFSRAGATANLTSKRLVEKYGEQGAKVFGYTLEAPQGAVDHEEKYPENLSSKYYCIHNVINYTDLVPLVGPSAMGFKRYGVDHYVPGGNAGSVSHDDTTAARASDHEVLTTITTYYDNQRIETDSDAYPAARAKMLKQLPFVDPDMSFDDYFATSTVTIIPPSLAEQEVRSGSVNEERFIRDLVEKLQEWSIPNRTEYAHNLQPAFKDVMATFFGMSDETKTALIDKAMNITSAFGLGDLPKLIQIYDDCVGDWTKISQSKKNGYVNYFVGKLKATGALDVLSQSERDAINKNAYTLFDFIFNVLAGDYNNKSYDTSTLMMLPTMINNVGRIMANHYPEINLAWLRSYDSYYAEENCAYAISAPDSVEPPMASASGIELDASKENSLAGKQRLHLGVKDLKGEAIYYKLTNEAGDSLVVDPACANGYQIYRDGIDLECSVGESYKLTAYAMSYGTKSAEVTYTINGRREYHTFRLINNAKGTENLYSVKEGESFEVEALVPEGMKFKSWIALDENENNVTDKVFKGEEASKQKAKVVIPNVGADGLSHDFSLTVRASFEEQVDTVKAAFTIPDNGPLPSACTVSLWHEGVDTTASQPVSSVATWSYQNDEGETVHTSTLYAKTTYTVHITLPQKESNMIPATATPVVKKASEEDDNSSFTEPQLSRNADGTVTISAKYETGDGVGIYQLGVPYTIKVQRLDVNDPEKEITDPEDWTITDSDNPFDVDSYVENAVFVGWEVPAGSGIARVEGQDNQFRVTSTANPDKAIIQAFYKPIISQIDINGLQEGGLGVPAVGGSFEATAGVTYRAKESANGARFENKAGQSGIEWSKSDGTVINPQTDVAESETAYHARLSVDPSIVFPGANFQCEFADTVIVAGNNHAIQKVFIAAEKSVHLDFGHTDTRYHKVNIKKEGGAVVQTSFWLEGQEVSIDPVDDSADSDAFKEYLRVETSTGSDVTKYVLAEGSTVPGSTVRIKMPTPGDVPDPTHQGGSCTFDTGYELYVIAKFVPKAKALRIELPTPGHASTEEYSDWLAGGAKAKYSFGGVDQEGTGNAYWERMTKNNYWWPESFNVRNSDYRVTVRLDAETSRRVAAGATLEMVDPYDTSKVWQSPALEKKPDGTLVVTATFTTGSDTGRIVADSLATYTVAVRACDANAAVSQNTRPQLADVKVETYSFVEEPSNDTTVVLTAPQVPGARFVGWQLVDGLTMEQGQQYASPGSLDAPMSATFGVVMGGDSGRTRYVNALYVPIVESVAIKIDKPAAGQNILTKENVSVSAQLVNNTSGFLPINPVVSSLVWDPNEESGTFAYGEDYLATVTLGKDTADRKFVYADDLKVSSDSNEQAGEENGQEGQEAAQNQSYVAYGYKNSLQNPSLEAVLSFATTDIAKLEYVLDPDNIFGLAHGTDIKGVLPVYAEIVTTDPTIEYARVTWADTIQTVYDGGKEYESIYLATGTIELPEGVQNPDNVELAVSTYVFVEAPEDTTVYADMPNATLEPDEYSSPQSIGLYTNEEGGEVWYKTKEGDDFKKYDDGDTPDSIELTPESLDEDGLLVIQAFTKAPGKENSPEVVFAYSLVNAIPVPANTTLTYRGEEQVGVWGGTGYTLTGGDGVTIDEDGNACVANVGTYSVVAKLDQNYSWDMGLDEQTGNRITSGYDQTITFTIEPEPMSFVTVDPIAEQSFTGEPITPEPKVYINEAEEDEDYVLKKDVDYTLEYQNNTEPGTGKVIIKGKGNFTGTIEKEFQIASVTITYDANGGAGTMEPQKVGRGAETPLGENKFTREGYVFNGWDTTPEGTGDPYYEGEPVTFTEDTKLYAQWARKTYKVAAFSRAKDANVSVADISIDPGTHPYEEGSTVTITAPAKRGWAFVGWYPVTKTEEGLVSSYDEDAQVSNKRSFSFVVTENVKYVAVYEASTNVNATVRIAAVNGASYTISQDGVLDASVQQGSKHSVPIGTKLTVTAQDPGKVVMWLNESDKVIGTGQQSLDYTVTSDTTISLVYLVDGKAQTQVKFISDYDQVLLYRRYPSSFSDASKIEIAAPPTRLGQTFTRWVFDGTTQEATPEAILAKVQNPAQNYAEVIVRSEYANNDEKYKVSVYTQVPGQEPQLNTEVTANKGKVATVNAPAVEGMDFECWRNAEGNLLGYTTQYRLYEVKDTNVYAHYVAAGTQVERVPVIAITGFAKFVETDKTHKIQCLMARNVPDGYTMVEHGVLYGTDLGGLSEDKFVYGTEGVLRFIYKSKTLNNAAFLSNVVSTDDTEVYYRAYMVLKKNGSQELQYYYSGIESASYNSIDA